MPAKFEKPRPGPPKAEPAFRTLSEKEREVPAEDVQYVGSPHHTDVPKYGSPSSPRYGFATVGLDLPMHGYVFPALALCSAGDEAVLVRLNELRHFNNVGNVIEEPVGKVLCKIADVGCFREFFPMSAAPLHRSSACSRAGSSRQTFSSGGRSSCTSFHITGAAMLS